MRPYNKFIYLYPPRPKNPIHSDDLNFWDNNSMIAQPKFNGSNSVLFTNGITNYKMGRHGQNLTNFNLVKTEIDYIHELSGLDKGQWLVLNGEYLNKNKLDENNKSFNHKFIIFDILVYHAYLIGETHENRILRLDGIFGKNESEKDYLYSISDNFYRTKSYTNGFLPLYNEFSKIDVLEGLVLKRKNAKLELGNTENNNTKSMIKCRKMTKLYKY